MIFINVEDVIGYHTKIINEFGGWHGIKDLGLLISAVQMPKAKIYEEFLHDSIFDKASAYLFHIIYNHPFIDGNKRTGTVTALTFLQANDIKLNFDPLLLEELVVKVAQGSVKKEGISLFFESSLENGKSE